jgi:5-methylcytosine-specific restriction endonuclease McrA
MPFSESVKQLAKSKAAFRCCVCHAPFVEVHHLTPEAQGGPSGLENAAPLCASCHDLYGGNPEKRKTLTQMRDAWWAAMEERHRALTDLSERQPPYSIEKDPNAAGGLHSTSVAI